MDNIIEFPKRKEPSSPYDTEGIIDTTKKGFDLEISIGLFWHNLYSGQSIKEIYADDDGIIKYELEWADPYIPNKEDLHKHVQMMMRFINKHNLACPFLEEHELFVKETGIDRYFKLDDPKEDKPNDVRID